MTTMVHVRFFLESSGWIPVKTVKSFYASKDINAFSKHLTNNNAIRFNLTAFTYINNMLAVFMSRGRTYGT